MFEDLWGRVLARIFGEYSAFHSWNQRRQSPDRKRRRWLVVLTVLVLLVSSATHNWLGSLIEYLAIIALVVQITLYALRGYDRAHGLLTGGSVSGLLSGKPAKSGVAEALAPDPHDLARIYHMNSASLPTRGFAPGMPIAIGRNLGVIGARFWSPHALVLGATGSGKTTLLRPFIGRWLAENPASVMSTKGDIIPESLPGTPGIVHLVTPTGRKSLDKDGQARLDSLEAAGWQIEDVRWDPAIWCAQGDDQGDTQGRSGALARCLAGVVIGGLSEKYWSAAAADLIEAGLIIEAAAIRAGVSSWHELIDPAGGGKTGSDGLLNSRSSSREPGVARLYQELDRSRLTSWKAAQEISPTLSPTEVAAFSEILETGALLTANNSTALSRYQTMSTALGCYKYPSPTPRSPVDIPKWAASDNDLLVVIVPSDDSESWSASMAALAVAVWTEASGKEDRDHLIVLDEAASLAPVPSLKSWIAQGRSLGVHVVAVLQNEDQAKVWAGNDTTGWILNTWPVALVASGTPAYGLAKHLADGEGQHEVEKITENRDAPDTWFGEGGKKSTSSSKEMRDRIEPNDVFSEAILGAWRVVDRRVGPWASPWRG